MLCHKEFSRVFVIVLKWTIAHFLATFELVTSQQSYSSKKKILESYLGVPVSSDRCDLCLTYYMIMMNIEISSCIKYPKVFPVMAKL